MSVIETATVPLAQQQADALLNVKDLRVTFSTPDGDVTACFCLSGSVSVSARRSLARLAAATSVSCGVCQFTQSISVA